jgi:glycosyltransferase involved in cell wall biosynthesis
VTAGHPRVLVLARSYPTDVLPSLGLWTERPTVLLQGNGCDMQVVSPVPYCPPLPSAGPLRQYTRFRSVRRRETRNGVDVLHPRFLVGPGTTLYATEASSYYRGVADEADRLHEERAFDLIHAHFIYPDGAVAHRLASRWGVPFVVTEHAPWTGWLDRRGVARAALPAARAAATIMAVSSSVERTIRAYAGDGPRVEVVPVGVDTALFRLPSDPRTPDQILFVGFLNYTKGIDVLLDAMALLRDGGIAGRAVLVGGGFYRNTRKQEETLRRRAAELDLGDRVTFAGRKPPTDVARLMAESAVVVLPSRAGSFGAVLVEALACGTPVVATRCGGPEDIVSPEVGELVPVADPRALADALSRTLADPARYDAAHLRDYALTRFGWETVVADVRRAYHDATVAPAAPPAVGAVVSS